MSDRLTATVPQLRVSLHCYDHATVLTTHHADGSTTAYPVDPRDVATTLGHLPATSGLLPRNALFWLRYNGTSCLGIYVPPRRWRIHTPDRQYRLPLPPLILVGMGTRYHLLAVTASPTESSRLYFPPLPNIMADASVCPGNSQFPICSTETIYPALQLILEGSAFNNHAIQKRCHKYPDDVRHLWHELDGRRRFPLAELVATNATLGSFIRQLSR